MQLVIDAIKGTAKTGEIITIIYNGGSSPGQERELIVISANPETMQAQSPKGGPIKKFRYDKIASVTIGDKTFINPTAQARAIDPPDIYPSLPDYFPYIRNHIALNFWHLVSGASQVALYRLLKNGKPGKHPSLILTKVEFVPQTEEWDWLKDCYRTITHNPEHHKPWLLRDKIRKTGTSYKHLQRAVYNFVALAKKHSES